MLHTDWGIVRWHDQYYSEKLRERKRCHTVIVVYNAIGDGGHKGVHIYRTSFATSTEVRTFDPNCSDVGAR